MIKNPNMMDDPGSIWLTLRQADLHFCPKCGQNLRQNLSSDFATHFDTCLGPSWRQAKDLIKLPQCQNCHKNFQSCKNLEKHRFFCDPSPDLAGFVKNSPLNSSLDMSENSKSAKSSGKRSKVECPVCAKSF